MPNTDCPICFEKIGRKNVVTTVCGHKFHHICLCQHTATSRSTKCPICRQNFAKSLPKGNDRRRVNPANQAILEAVERDREVNEARIRADLQQRRFQGIPHYQSRLLPPPINVDRAIHSHIEQITIQEQGRDQNEDYDRIAPIRVRLMRLADNTIILREINGQRIFSYDAFQEIGYLDANNTPIFFPIA